MERSQLDTTSSTPLRVLDVGCGVGGTTRYLASTFGATVTGITISSKQVEIATRLTKTAASKETASTTSEHSNDFTALGKGQVRFLELDAEKMGDYFGQSGEKGEFDVVWISEALSHFPNKPLFFHNAEKVLKKGGKLVLADWFKDVDVKEGDADIKAIEGESLLFQIAAGLCTDLM